MRDSSLAVQREGVPEEEEEPPVQTMRSSAFELALQRQADPSYAGSSVGGLQSRGAVVVQRSMAGSFPVTQGIWEMGMITQEGAVKGTGPSGLQGTIKFAPGKDSPYSNHIALIQIVKLTDAGGANVNPASMPSGHAPHLRTTEDKAKGVEGGYFTDVLHNDFTGTGKDAPKGSNLPPNYPFGPSGGSQVLGFKRSEEPADIKAAELFDFPGTTSNTSNLDFSFETVAKGTDSLNVYGSVKWAFGLRAGRVVGESGPHVNDVASATFNAALEKHRDFYVHEPVSFHFLFDSDEMEPGDEAKADSFLDYLRKFPDVRLNLHGFADQRGSVDYNKKLAMRRANKTAQVLIAKGVSADRINPLVAEGKTTGFTDDATTNQDREANRRGNRTVLCVFEHTATPGTPP
jgi:outer membrane protein OmpA-like peptidoglycan-associated protein